MCDGSHDYQVSHKLVEIMQLESSSKINTQNVILINIQNILMNITSGLRLSDLTLLKIGGMSFKANEV